MIYAFEIVDLIENLIDFNFACSWVKALNKSLARIKVFQRV